MRMGVWLLEVEQILPSRLQQAVDVEHRDTRLRILEGQTFLNHGRRDQASEADGRGTGAEEEDALVAHLAASDLESGDQSGERHAAGPLNVVVVTADLVAVAGQQTDRVAARPVLEVDAAIREDLLHRVHELAHEG